MQLIYQQKQKQWWWQQSTSLWMMTLNHNHDNEEDDMAWMTSMMMASPWMVTMKHQFLSILLLHFVAIIEYHTWYPSHFIPCPWQLLVIVVVVVVVLSCAEEGNAHLPALSGSSAASFSSHTILMLATILELANKKGEYQQFLFDCLGSNYTSLERSF